MILIIVLLTAIAWGVLLMSDGGKEILDEFSSMLLVLWYLTLALILILSIPVGLYFVWLYFG